MAPDDYCLISVHEQLAPYRRTWIGQNDDAECLRWLIHW